MKFWNILIFSICLAGLFQSCKKSDPESPMGIHNRYFPLETGNYWIFDFQQYLPDGTPSGTIQIDTLRVMNDTTINQAKFFTLITDKPAPNTTWYLKDSVGYIINHHGITILTPEPNGLVYNQHYNVNNDTDTLYYYYDEFPSKRLIESFEGDLVCLERFTTHEMHENLGGNTIIDSSYYSVNGPVRLSYSYASGVKLKGELTEYHLE